MSNTLLTQSLPEDLRGVNFAWLEITPSCQFTCDQCYVRSMPGLGHGKMKVSDWKRVLDQLQELGCDTVQFIGGEPTIHPHFCELVEYAVEHGFAIEVYTNLVGITQRMWDMFVHNHVLLATSFYTNDPSIHDRITKLKGSFEKTLSNIKKALELGLLLRVGMVDMKDEQGIPEGRELVEQLGVKNIQVDRVRGVGRGENLAEETAVDALCGQCARGKCAVIASGEVYPCVFGRSFSVGNILTSSLSDVINGQQLTLTRMGLQFAFLQRQVAAPCRPSIECSPDDRTTTGTVRNCNPDDCGPISGCDPDAAPCSPSEECHPDQTPACVPDGKCSPWN